MIISTGYGYLVAVIVLGFALAGNIVFDAAFGKGYYESHLWTVAPRFWQRPR